VGFAHLRTSLIAAAIALAGLAFAGAARAHDTSYSAVDLDLRADGAAMRVTIHSVDLAYLLDEPPPPKGADAGLWLESAPRLATLVAGRCEISADGRRLTPQFIGATRRDDGRGLTLEFRAPWTHRPGRLDVRARLLPEDPQHETFLNVFESGRALRQDVLSGDHWSATVFGAGGAGLWAVAASFVPTGIHHIFTGPDHILFVIGLLLLGGSLSRLLKIVSGFTLAHSLTLALAALGIVNPPVRLIEPLIAASIVLVGVENLMSRPGAPDRRAALAFGFGLIHGFGFAGVLRETGLPREALAAALVSFNVGVEMGQACIVLAFVPLLAWMRARLPRQAPALLGSGSWAVIVAGGWWLVQRVFAG
jgi:hydrogenase/urease accessory protein HupE